MFKLCTLTIVLLLSATAQQKVPVEFFQCSVRDVVDILSPEAQLRLDDVRAVIISCECGKDSECKRQSFEIELPRNKWPEEWAAFEPEELIESQTALPMRRTFDGRLVAMPVKKAKG